MSNERSHPNIPRRDFLAIACAAAAATQLGAAARRPPRILLRSSWQTVNIGDIAHTPGVLALLEKHLPDAEVRLWPSKVDNGVKELLQARFPKVSILSGAADIDAAFDECDFLLHGSGPFLVAERDVVKWKETTGKPYGVFGITLSDRNYTTKAIPAEAFRQTINVLSGARFVFFRDSPSLKFGKERGCTSPIMEFGPDGAFATDLKDDERADAFLRKHELATGKFLCCIPRLRYTPYWTIPERKTPFDKEKDAHNEAHKVADHAPLLEAITEVIRQTDLKILLCPEDQTQMKIGKELLLEKLPDDVRKRVVWRPDYWLTGEARSVYLRSAGLFGHEMHSPIMCIGAGVPAIVCRWSEQTSKGLMWRDIGLGDWLFDMDAPEDVAKIVPTVLALAKDPQAAKKKAERAKGVVEERQSHMVAVLAKALE
jgi:polysaccharide pyruvyl transferase WcaK-like protein